MASILSEQKTKDRDIGRVLSALFFPSIKSKGIKEDYGENCQGPTQEMY